MPTSTPSSILCPPADLPIIVEDRRRRGFFQIDNLIIDEYAPQLGAYGVAVYNVLSRFANRKGECFPSQATIAKRLDMSRMQVSREITKLKVLGLIEVHPQYGPNGEQRANLYILCDIPTAEPPVTHRYTPRHHELHPPVTGSDTPCNRQLHKQDPKNKTQLEQNPEEQQQTVVASVLSDSTLVKEELTDNTLNKRMNVPEPTPVLEPTPINSSRTTTNENSLSAAQQSSAAALITIGLAETVAHQLAEDYSPAHIVEKLEYLDYLQAEHPTQVLRPCGWLRRAIEEDYAAPDGYQSAVERIAEAAERARCEAEHEQFVADQRQQAQAMQEQACQTEAIRLAELQSAFGTTQRELDLWQLLLQEFKLSLPADTFFGYVGDTVLLALKDGEALIGLPMGRARGWLENRFRKQIERTLSSSLKQKVTVQFITLPALAREGSLEG